MKNLVVLFFCVIFGSQVSFAHDANMFTSYIYKKDNRLLMKLSMAHDGIHSATKKSLRKSDIGKLGDENYDQKILNYLKNSIEVYDGPRRAAVNVGKYSFGSHQSDVYFELTGLRKNVTKLQVVLKLGSENPHHTNLLRVIDPKTNLVSGKYFLRAHNEWRQEVSF